MLIFKEDTHEYILDGKKLQSVSSWIKQFEPPFDKDNISQAVAKKEGVDQQTILDKWEQKKNISLHLGNWVHDSIEYYIKFDKNFSNQPVEAFKKYQSNNKYYSEIIVHDDEIAGTIDIIEVLENREVIIHDFKTNEDLYKGYGKLLPPYNDLDNIPINKYRLQLSKYKELLEKSKKVKVIQLNIWHYKDGEFNIIKINEVKPCQKKQMKLEL